MHEPGGDVSFTVKGTMRTRNMFQRRVSKPGAQKPVCMCAMPVDMSRSCMLLLLLPFEPPCLSSQTADFQRRR